MADNHNALAEIMPDAPTGADQRRHRRVRLPLPVRYMQSDQSEHAGIILNISASGALIKAECTAQSGEEILIYIKKLGRFEATIVRVEDDTFAVSFKQKRRQKQSGPESLAWLLSKGEEFLNHRQAHRIKQNKPATAIFLDGTETPCRIVDISITGAFVELDPKPPVGQFLVIGCMNARVVRHHEDGIGVEFIKKINQ